MNRLFAIAGATLIAAVIFACTGSAFAVEKKTGNARNTPAVVTDPVCNMKVETANAKYVYEYKGKKYYFCMKDDMDKFRNNPEKYMKKDGVAR